MKVTICWTDPAGTPQPVALNPTNIVLVNDLDLRVISPDGATTNLPWVLDGANPTNAATKGDNIRDNVEQVQVDSPSNGWYTVRVTHKGTLQTNGIQDVSIIIAGNTATNMKWQFTAMELDSGYHNVTWDAAVGDIHCVITKDDLMDTNDWSDASDDMSITKDVMTWRDDDYYGTNSPDEIRFYMLKNAELD